MSRAMARVLPGTSLVLLLAAALLGCGRDERAATGEPWPLSLRADVVDYAAVRLPDDFRDQLAREVFGFAPAGLDAGRPLIALGLDAKAFGGSNALLLPLRDESAFRASLDAAPVLHHGARDDYVLEIPADSALGRLRLFANGFGSVQSVSDMLRAMQEAGPQSVVFQVTVVDDWACLAPTFEAASACQQVLHETGGFAGAPPHDLVVAADVARLRVVYAEELQRLEDQFKAAIGGVQAAGLLNMAAAMHGDDALQLPFGVRWEFVWALKEMLPLAALEAVQLREPQLGSGPPPALGSSRRGEDVIDWLMKTRADDLRLRLTPGTPQAELVAALRPAPDVPDARLVIAADGPAFGRALAHWIRPLGRLVTGDGPPCDRYLDELATLLASAGGVFALQETEGGPCLLATAGVAPPDLLPRLQAWTAKLLSSAGVDLPGGLSGGMTARDLPDGRTELLGADGSVLATIGRREDVFWLRSGAAAEEPSAAVTAFQRALSVPAPADAPVLRWRGESTEVDVHASGRDLQIDVRRLDDGR
jgi:hypothetical protein